MQGICRAAARGLISTARARDDRLPGDDLALRACPLGSIEVTLIELMMHHENVTHNITISGKVHYSRETPEFYVMIYHA